MSNQPYPVFGKVKTIVLPFNSEDDRNISLTDYKAKYGIDLKEIFQFNEDYENPKIPKNTLFIIAASRWSEDLNYPIGTDDYCLIIPQLCYVIDDTTAVAFVFSTTQYNTDDGETAADEVTLEIGSSITWTAR